MINAAEDEEGGAGDTSTPPLANPPPQPDGGIPPHESTVPYDKTIKLDRVIAERNLSVPTRFGRYEVIERIGIGGFASVFSARDPELDAQVAIKVLAENHSADVEVRKRFVAEARVARRLGGDRLIGVFDLGETDDGRPYVVMELASGGTLRSRLQRIGRPSPASLIRLIEELGACMYAVHQKGVIHRDIKPSNLLLRVVDNAPDRRPTKLIEDHERVVLADFGLARDISGGASAITVGGGTAGYMAPEQADPSGKADVRADIYAATVVLAELTTGRHPERLDLPTARISGQVREVLEQGLSMDRDQRPASAVAWRDALRTAYATPTAEASISARARPEPGSDETRDPTIESGPEHLAATADSAPAHDEHDSTPTIVHHDGELTAPIDATRIRPPHQFRNGEDAEFDEAGLETPVPIGIAAPDSATDDEQSEPTVEVEPSAPTRQLADADLAVDAASTAHAGDLDRTAILPDDELPNPKPRTFVRPVVDSEPPPPPPSIPLSTRAQRPPPSAQPRKPPADSARPSTATPQTHASRPEAAATAPAQSSPRHRSAHPTARQPAPPPTAQPPATAQPPPTQPPAVQPPAVQPPTLQPPPPAAPPPPAHPSAEVAKPPPSRQQASRPAQARARATPPSAPPPVPNGPGSGPGAGPAPGNRMGPIPSRPARQAPSRQAGPPTPAQVRQERRQARRWERRRRWRRRRRRFSNVIRALIRGLLALVVMSIIAAVAVAAANGEQVNALSADSERIVNVVGIASFFLGLRLFPWPRRLDPHG